MVRHPRPSPPAEIATTPGPQPGRAIPRLLADLLALNEEMVRQLDLERPHAAESDPFIAVLMDQHAASAALLREHLLRFGSAVASPPAGTP